MLLVPLIAALWTASLLLVAVLCAAARGGDDQLRREAFAPESVTPQLRAGTPVRAHEPGEAPLSIAA